MLFNSYAFIFLFLPLVWFVYRVLLVRAGVAAVIAWLGFASMVFYAVWDVRFLPLLGASIGTNFILGRLIRDAGQTPAARLWLLFGIFTNIVVLGFFKYASFLADIAGAMSQASLFPVLPTIVLPLGISFFTFHQIVYLVETHRGNVVRHRFADYLLFVSFFPQLIAGPIVKPSEVLPQLAARNLVLPDSPQVARALTIFLIGLGKKVLLADSLAGYANPVFDAAAAGAQPTLIEAWGGTLAYTFQLYFDFSGYSDMAIGLGLLFGVSLPVNFNSPYKASNITEFWRRWHITLSRLLRDYLYIPLGGSRQGTLRTLINLMVVMLLGGLWHGANWTFVAWGALHGFYLLVHRAWQGMRADALRATSAGGLGVWHGRLLTFVAVMLAWVLFRSENWTAVQGVYSGLIGLNGVVLPATFSSLSSLLSAIGVRVPVNDLAEPYLFYGREQILWLAASLAIVWLLPNTLEWTAATTPEAKGGAWSRFRWSPRISWAVALVIGLGAVVVRMGGSTEFLYFQF